MSGRIHDTGDLDDYILRLLKADDPYAMQLIFDTFRPWLTDIIARSISDKGEAEELIHNLFVNLWIKRHTLNLTKPLARYMLKAALNRVRNYLRDSTRLKRMHAEATRKATAHQVPLAVPADSNLRVQEIKALLKMAMNKMSSRVQLTFRLSRNDQLTYAQIAQVMGVSIKTVEKNMATALRILHRLLDDYREVIILAAGLGQML